jgi:hypothetical protein
MSVPLHFIGEDVAPGVKQAGGAISHLMNEVDIVWMWMSRSWSLTRC